MAHFAEINSEDNRVLRIITVYDGDVQNNGGEYSEQSEQWVAANHPNCPIIKEKFNGFYPQTYWKQTSYNTRFGKYYNSDGTLGDQSKARRLNHGVDRYDPNLDAFVYDQPYPSWIFNSTTGAWDPPVPRPNDGNAYNWKESTKSWELFDF